MTWEQFSSGGSNFPWYLSEVRIILVFRWKENVWAKLMESLWCAESVSAWSMVDGGGHRPGPAPSQSEPENSPAWASPTIPPCHQRQRWTQPPALDTNLHQLQQRTVLMSSSVVVITSSFVSLSRCPLSIWVTSKDNYGGKCSLVHHESCQVS